MPAVRFDELFGATVDGGALDVAGTVFGALQSAVDQEGTKGREDVLFLLLLRDRSVRVGHFGHVLLLPSAARRVGCHLRDRRSRASHAIALLSYLMLEIIA